MEIIKDKKFIIDVSRASTLAFIFSLIFTGLLSVIIHYTSIGDVAIDILNISFRCIAIMLGMCIGIKDKNNGLLKGVFASLIYIVNVYLMFSMLSKDFSFGYIKMIDSVSSFIFGIISAIIAVNIKSK